MGTQIIRRLLTLVPVLAVVAVVVFMLIHLAPGDPAAVMAGNEATSERIEQLRHQMGLDRPLPEQFLSWVTSALRGDLGESYFLNQPVSLSLMQRIEPTGLLTLYALLFSIVIGLPAGIIAAMNRNTWIDRLTMVTALGGVCIPSFWFGILLILFFAVSLRWLPAAGYVPFTEDPLANLRYLVMPAFSLGLQAAALLARVVRSSMLEVLREDYIRTARAKGLRERFILVRHAMPNAMIPALTIIGNSMGTLLGGAVVTEAVFNTPGVGRLVVQSVLRRDFPVIQGAVLTIAAVYILVNLVVDIAYAVVDPRIREGSR
ncbi:MAG: ABC transporter permease [Chloroflexi bacterium]|nr:ABC transporter permease [Chloroflexota bacterium]